MAKSILIINGNPAKKRVSFCASLAEAYAKAAIAAGAAVTRVELKDLQFDVVLHEGYEDDQALEPDLERVQAALLQADHIVFIFPLWHGMPPALFKGFMDRVIRRGFAFNYNAKGWPEPTAALRGKSAEIMLSCSMPGWLYQYFSGAHASRALASILKMCGITLKAVTPFGFMSQHGAAAERRIASYLDKAAKLGRRAAG